MAVYSASEYDAFTVGAFRRVQSYCPRRHTYVTDIAAPIVAATVQPAQPDAQMQRERLPGAISTTYDKTIAERQAEREARVIAAIEAAGEPITLAVAAQAAGVKTETLNPLLNASDKLRRLYRSKGALFIGLAHHTLADVPYTGRAANIVRALRALGEGTVEEMAAYLGLAARPGSLRMSVYDHLVTWREEERSGNGGRQIYTARVYRLREGI